MLDAILRCLEERSWRWGGNGIPSASGVVRRDVELSLNMFSLMGRMEKSFVWFILRRLVLHGVERSSL